MSAAQGRHVCGLESVHSGCRPGAGKKQSRGNPPPSGSRPAARGAAGGHPRPTSRRHQQAAPAQQRGQAESGWTARAAGRVQEEGRAGPAMPPPLTKPVDQQGGLLPRHRHPTFPLKDWVVSSRERLLKGKRGACAGGSGGAAASGRAVCGAPAVLPEGRPAPPSPSPVPITTSPNTRTFPQPLQMLHRLWNNTSVEQHVCGTSRHPSTPLHTPLSPRPHLSAPSARRPPGKPRACAGAARR